MKEVIAVNNNYRSNDEELFYRSFPVRMRNSDVFSPRHAGLRVIGRENIDDDRVGAFMGDYTTVNKTPVALTVLYYQGINFSFANNTDLTTVYVIITQHLDNWARILEESKYMRRQKMPPKAQLLMLDSFRKSIANVALQRLQILDMQKRNNDAERGHFDEFIASLTPMINSTDDSAQVAAALDITFDEIGAPISWDTSPIVQRGGK